TPPQTLSQGAQGWAGAAVREACLSPGLLPVPQPPDAGWAGGQLPGHYSRPMGHVPDQTQGPGCPDLHPLAGAAGPLPAP
ncbi:hypothetical protein E2I00_005040, partial [Balaenoptera physalus]